MQTPSPKFNFSAGIPQSSGIYRIYVVKSDDCYVGASQNLLIRSRSHETIFRDFRHKASCLMLQAILRYGVEAFRFEILELCPADTLREREAEWMRKLKPSLNTHNEALFREMNAMRRHHHQPTSA